MSYSTITEKQPTNEESRAALWQQELQEQQERAWMRAEALIQKIGQAYDEFTRLIQQFPEVGRLMSAGIGQDSNGFGEASIGSSEARVGSGHDSEGSGETTVGAGEGNAGAGEGSGAEGTRRKLGRAVYERIRRENLALAEAAPRCRWVKQDGTLCRCPQMKNDVYCFAHRQMREAHTLALRLPAQEDANAIQIGLMQVQKALIEDRISTKKAGLLLYSMQLALQNVGQVTFGQARDEEMLRETVTEEEAFKEIGSSGDRDIGSSESQNQNRFTEEGAKDAMEIGASESQNQKLTTETLRHGGRAEDIEFVPMAGGYGFHRMRLRIGDEGRPVQVAAAERNGRQSSLAEQGHATLAEPHANMG
jgi:hypothetical protein